MDDFCNVRLPYIPQHCHVNTGFGSGHCGFISPSAYSRAMSDVLHDDSALPELPVLAVFGCEICVLDDDGVLETIQPGAALKDMSERAHLVCHAVFTAGTLRALAGGNIHDAIRAAEGRHLDVMELFAFVRPAQYCRPTVQGLAQALGLSDVTSAEEAALKLANGAARLLDELGERAANDARLARLTLTLARAGCGWGTLALRSLAGHGINPGDIAHGSGLDIWRAIKPVDDRPSYNRAAEEAVAPEAAREALADVLGPDAEIRNGQSDYAAALSAAFQPRDDEGPGQVMLAEAGTGIGKTLGYLAPAALWAKTNDDTVWLSTFTRNLQRQIDAETGRIYPSGSERAEKVVIRKGRENYLCLLNFEDLAAAPQGRMALLAALIARWALASRDGDMIGGDFPAWLPSLFIGARAFGEAAGGAPAALLGLTDRRGECIHSACAHYNRCFIEKSARKARRAKLVIANHAFVMSRAAMALDAAAPERKTGASSEMGARFVFDEGHHVFDAADSAFSLHLTGLEMADMRRWLRGREKQRVRGRGLKERIGDLLADDEEAVDALQGVLGAARKLPAPAWQQRLKEGTTRNIAENFLAMARKQVLARSKASAHFSQETLIQPPVSGLCEAADQLHAALGELTEPLMKIAKYLRRTLKDKAAELDSSERARLEGAAIGIERRATNALPAWRSMLAAVSGSGENEAEREIFADWFCLERYQGREFDVGLHRHWIDPGIPFARTVLEEADAVVITSATLRDRPPETPEHWHSAHMRTGANHLATPAKRFAVNSPFDYPANSRVYVITDVSKTDAGIVASAYRELFLASGGGALGLFTAIHRLRAVQARLISPLLNAGMALYAQHIDPLDTGTLVDIFRAEENSCLLGTDALRDGVDVPGRALRLVVFDRVPWPRGSILERARRSAFGGNAWTDMTTRLKLAQAFGRLIRRQNDKGVFVMLDRQLPTRLTSAFPAGVEVQRVGLAQAVDEIHGFLSE